MPPSFSFLKGGSKKIPLRRSPPVHLTKRYPFVFKGWRLYPASIKALSVALSEQRLSNYRADNMQILKEYFENVWKLSSAKVKKKSQAVLKGEGVSRTLSQELSCNYHRGKTYMGRTWWKCLGPRGSCGRRKQVHIKIIPSLSFHLRAEQWGGWSSGKGHRGHMFFICIDRKHTENMVNHDMHMIQGNIITRLYKTMQHCAVIL